VAAPSCAPMGTSLDTSENTSENTSDTMAPPGAEVAGPARVRVIASAQSWIEGEAVRQLEGTARLAGMRLAVGMPDLHPGKGSPVGAAFASSGVLHPFLVGNDIGCGIGLWRTDLPRRKAKRDRWVDRLHGLEGPWDGDTSAWLEAHGVTATGPEPALGTIGGGNHFAELSAVSEVMEPDAFGALGLDEGRFVLLVHSGSRGLGDAILREHTDRFGAGGLEEGTPEAAHYLARHDRAVGWGRANRALIAQRFLECVGARGERVADVCHNSVTPSRLGGERLWLHRKGAAPTDSGPVLIAGSRGTPSYLVRPVGDGESNACSLAHGAGRRWPRSDARQRLARRFTAEALTHTELGGRVICEDKDLLFEEAPQAYKRIDRVIQDLTEAGVAEVIAAFSPLITYKLRAASR